MGRINILDEKTINLIAAGEVVERPASVVKELVENAIDSGADTITVEIKKGGIEFIRITDNGSGFYKDDIKRAFLRHTTSKIKDANDITGIASMGFRGEALSSISAVSKVELITKRNEDLTGYSYMIEGDKGGDVLEVGAPDGTTIIVRNLFFNTPARRKYLKSENAESNAISDCMQHLALGRPDISFKFINNGKLRFQTTGKKDIKEIIYRIYGRDTSNEMIPINYSDNEITVTGYLGKPSINRSNRNFETYYINNRYIHSDTIAKGIEEGYSEYLMQHKFPFCVLHIDMDFAELDVNVHPAKMEVRFNDNNRLHDFLVYAISNTLKSKEMIPGLSLVKENDTVTYEKTPEQFEINRIREQEKTVSIDETNNDSIDEVNVNENITLTHGNLFNIDFENGTSSEELFDDEDVNKESDVLNIDNMSNVGEESELLNNNDSATKEITNNVIKNNNFEQLSFIEKEERVLSDKARKRFKIIGQVFNTYWIIEYSDSIYFVDQHAAHEKVNYERMMKRALSSEILSQYLNPPLVITLSGQELTCLMDNIEYFKQLGFEIEDFGGNEVRLSAVPYELYSASAKEMFLEALDELMSTKTKAAPEIILSRIATMACKASVKGGDKLSLDEINALLDELLSLDNPYNCPHGRPTIFNLTRVELEKKFKRIVD